MKKHFRYDYNYKLFIICNIVSFLFLLITIFAYNKDKIAFFLFFLVFIISIINAYILIYNQGIRIKNEKIIIVDFFWISRYQLIDLKFVEFNEVKKEKKSNFYGFMHEFYDPNTYMWKCDYVYNNGKVFNIIFHMRDGSIIDTYFGWMYKEKRKKTVEKVEKKLKEFINEINLALKRNNEKRGV